MNKHVEGLKAAKRKRVERMRKLRERGLSLREIGEAEGISAQRVHALLKDEAA